MPRESACPGRARTVIGKAMCLRSPTGSAVPSSPPTSASRLMATRWTGTSGSRRPLHGTSAPQGMNDTQEHPLPLVPRQQPVEQPVAAADDLAGHQDDRVHEPLELHPQQTALLLA